MPEKLHLMPCKAPAVRQLPLEAAGGVRGLCCSWEDFFSQEGERRSSVGLGLCSDLPAPEGLCRKSLGGAGCAFCSAQPFLVLRRDQ